MSLDAWLEEALSDDQTTYLQTVSTFFLDLRGTGLMLSPQDMLLVQEWLDAGFPLNQVLRGMQKGALSLLKRQLPLKTLRSLRAAVQKEVLPASPKRTPREPRARSFRASMQAQQAPPRCSGEALQRLLEEELDQLHQLRQALEGFQGMQEALNLLEGELRQLPALPGEPVGALLALSRRFYLQLWEVLPSHDRQQLLDDAHLARQGVQGLSSEVALEQGLDDTFLCTLLRARLNLLEPSRILQLWDEEG